MKTYWSQCANNKNFGDNLTPFLLSHMTRHTPLYAPLSDAEIVLVGSIGEKVPEAYNGIVAGIGTAYHSTKINLNKANVLALRGPLTFLHCATDQNPVLADPGLLISDFVDSTEKQYEVGTILHYADNYNKPEGHVINVTDPVDVIINEIAKCETIISSSLHGLIAADALNIPRKWVKFPNSQGQGFKFYDYSLTLGMHIKPNVWMQAPKELIKSKQQQLREVFQCL